MDLADRNRWCDVRLTRRRVLEALALGASATVGGAAAARASTPSGGITSHEGGSLLQDGSFLRWDAGDSIRIGPAVLGETARPRIKNTPQGVRFAGRWFAAGHGSNGGRPQTAIARRCPGGGAEFTIDNPGWFYVLQRVPLRTSRQTESIGRRGYVLSADVTSTAPITVDAFASVPCDTAGFARHSRLTTESPYDLQRRTSSHFSSRLTPATSNDPQHLAHAASVLDVAFRFMLDRHTPRTVLTIRNAVLLRSPLTSP